MRSITPWARVYVVAVAAGAALCAAPVRFAHAPWGAVALFAALCAACEQLAVGRFGAGRGYESPGAAAPGGAVGGPPRRHTPVLLAGAFLLPPEAAALVPLPGALLVRGGEHTPWPRRLWRAGQLGIGAWTASRVHGALGGPDTVVSSDFPYTLFAAGVSVVAFCLVLALLDGGILALAEQVPVRLAWRGLFVRSLVPVGVHGLAGLMMAVLWRSPYGPLAALLVLLPMWVSWWVFAQYHRERTAHQATIRALAQAVDIKDGYTRGHSERVGQASMMIARELGMDEERVEVLRFAGILHDVGKLGVPTRLLRKDGPLTPEERRVIELHPEYGHEMVRGSASSARPDPLHHHERLDGSGYRSCGLSGGESVQPRAPNGLGRTGPRRTRPRVATRIVCVVRAREASSLCDLARRVRPEATGRP
ncbi:HD domain-containing protein [Streptomyces sp. ME02-8801-2C]|uniref:HD-GYP domain-containing protein n=1 Tax=Streptomyces sp. ME02-8801-2C TaxID=3028680 RepID=UPI0029A81B3D|nr:HD domain-containing phosphohydrolase [Streptomyces sp. ME02-8801-2C]MDX3456664.1 HD domain-containing protein [Streptomyces sp. ME02-8801-2C]